MNQQYETLLARLDPDAQDLIEGIRSSIMGLASFTAPDAVSTSLRAVAEVTHFLQQIDLMRLYSRSFAELYARLPWLDRLDLRVFYIRESRTHYFLSVDQLTTDGSVGRIDPQFRDAFSAALMYPKDDGTSAVFKPLDGLRAFEEDLSSLYELMDQDVSRVAYHFVTTREAIEQTSKQGVNALAEHLFPGAWASVAPHLTVSPPQKNERLRTKERP